MDSLNPENPPLTVTAAPTRRGSGSSGAPLCGGPSSLPRCSLARSGRSWLSVLGGGWPVRSGAPRLVGSELQEIALSVIVGLPSVVCRVVARRSHHAGIVSGRSRAAPDLVAAICCSARSACRRREGWEIALSRATGHDIAAGFMGEVLAIGDASGGALVAGDCGVLRSPPRCLRRLFARGFLYRGWSAERPDRVPARSCCRRSSGPRCICNMTGSSSARCLRLASWLGYLRHRIHSIWCTIIVHGVQ